MTIEELASLRKNGQFDHATYRNHGTIWEGLWIYRKSETGFRGYEPAGAFFKGDPTLKDAEEIVRGSGVSIGSFGQG